MTYQPRGPYERMLMDRIEAISPDGFNRLESLSLLDQRVARRILFEILRASCGGQHIEGIMAGRNAFKRLPREWLSKNLKSAVNEAINMSNEWEYRRLLELIKEGHSGFLQEYIDLGMTSTNPEVREAATDFSEAK